MRFSSCDHSTTDGPFEAVDALFALRAEIVRLRQREAELCDEILTFAHAQECDEVLGAARMAVIETRRPRRIAPEHLPRELLLDPNVFRSREETVILLAPRAKEHIPIETETRMEARSISVPDPFVQADDPFDLKTAGPRMTGPDLPPVEVGDAPEGETPRDLRPTDHADLQPLAGLQEEAVAQMLADTEAPLPMATLPDALELVHTVEAKVDLIFEQDADEDASPPDTAFSSRRIATGGEG